MAGSRSAPRRFPAVPAKAALVLSQQTPEGPWVGAEPPAALPELHLPLSPPRCSSAERRGNAQLRSCPATCRTQTQKPGNASQWTFTPVDIPPHGSSGRRSLQRVLSSKAAPAARGSRAGHRSCPSTSAQGSSPRLTLQNTWVDEGGQSLECWPTPCQFWHFSHQSTRNKSHLLPCWFTGINEAPLCRGLSALLALPGYGEEFCRLQDITKSGRWGILNPSKWKQLPASAQTPAQLHLSN